ncbi:ATP synthase f1 [Mycena sanguinolenta]|uniref:ATP synthase f1 n=1 Tax=Mycena sanguinolenta TaxID=230812 RepID=A0A8H7CYW4_9AGAR|nr:ATP synthase f1 [Mycena sanguinolenta]
MPSRAATWTLGVPIQALSAPETETITDRNHSAESVIGRDFRELVGPADFRDGGKYRSIVKIQSRFRDSDGNDVWMMGTGWLIRPDILVTAGHVVYDHAYGYGATTQIKCYIGYNGAQSVPKQGYPTGDISAIPRYGSQIVTTESWIKDTDSRPRDVAFIRVHKPFVGNLNLFEFTDTHTISPAMLRVGVVGYPGDKNLNGEKGAQMYELFDSTPIDLDKHPRHMISYNISTYGGQSGAPVLSKTPAGLIAIGTHCYGAGNGEAKNTGNSIGGQWGNDYNLLISVFDLEHSNHPQQHRGPSEKPKTNPVADPQLPVHPEHVESLVDVLGKIARIGGPIIQAGSSLLGPMGKLVTSAAGGLIGALAGQESTMEALVKGRRSTDIIAPGVAERAVLAEASLQAVLRLMEQGDANDPVIKKVVHHMAHNYTYCAPKIGGLSSCLAPQLTECALDIAAQRLNRALTEPHQEAVFEPLPRKPLTGLPSTESSGKQEAFIECLLSPTCPLRGGEEGAFDFLGTLLMKAVSFAQPIVSQAANAVVNNVLPQATLSPVSPGNAEAADLIFTRALVADTAVSALMSLTREELDTLKIKRSAQEAGTEQQEGIVDFIKTTMQQIGPFALGTAKSVITRFAPVLIDIAANKLKEKISPSKGSEATPSLKRQPSNLDKYRPNGVATDSALKFSTNAGTLGGFFHRDNFLPKSRGDGFGDMKGRSANVLVFAAKGSSPQPTSTAPWNPDQPLILTTPPPDFPA